MLNVVEQVPEKEFLKYRHRVTQAFPIAVFNMFGSAGDMQIVTQRTELVFNTVFLFVFAEVSKQHTDEKLEALHTSSTHPSQQGHENWTRQGILKCSLFNSSYHFFSLVKNSSNL